MRNHPIFILFFILICQESLKATHIVGGELTYKCLGNNQYELTLIVYRDCYTGVPWFDDPAAIGVFDANWNLSQSFTIALNKQVNDTLPIVLSNPCLVAPPDVCVHGTIYKKIIALPYKPGGYHIVYQRCCRNNLIRNIIHPLDTGASFTVDISDAALEECNTGAVFNYWPPVAICVNEPINFDHSASDADGDSLVYRLCAPLTGADPDHPIPKPPFAGPYDPVFWQNPYNLANVLGGQPLYIDPKTGFMNGVPNLIGNFVVGVCVDEYRENQLISTTRRDFQYNVADCGKPNAAFFSPEALCDTLSYRFQNESSASKYYKWYFDVGGDTTQISYLPNPLHTFPDTGWYKILLIAESGDACTDSFYRDIHVTASHLEVLASVQFPACDDSGLIISALDLSKDTLYGVSSRLWTLTSPSGSLQQAVAEKAEFKVLEPGIYTLTIVSKSVNGCTASRSYTFKAPIPPLGTLQDTLTICLGDSVHLFPGADPDFQYKWTPGTQLSSDSVPDPLAFPSQNSIYQVKISDFGPCVQEKTVFVQIIPFDTLVLTATPPVIYVGKSTQLLITNPGASNYTYIWNPGASLNNTQIYNPVASPADTTTYTVQLPLSTNCQLRGIITVPVIFPVCEEPYVFFPSAFSPNGDGANDNLKLESRITSEVYWVIYDRWGERIFEAHSLEDQWDGTYRGASMPVETYGYYLRVRCENGALYEKKGNVSLLR